MSNTATPLFLASFFITLLLTLLIGAVLFQFGYCKLDDKSTFPIGTAPPSAGISEATPLVNEDL